MFVRGESKLGRKEPHRISRDTPVVSSTTIGARHEPTRRVKQWNFFGNCSISERSCLATPVPTRLLPPLSPGELQSLGLFQGHCFPRRAAPTTPEIKIGENTTKKKIDKTRKKLLLFSYIVWLTVLTLVNRPTAVVPTVFMIYDYNKKIADIIYMHIFLVGCHLFWNTLYNICIHVLYTT